MRYKKTFLAVFVLAGIVNALVFKVFEFVVNEGSDYVWNDVFNSDQKRWVVIPLATVLSILLSALFRWINRKRVTAAPRLNSLAVDQSGKPVSLQDIGIIAVIGAASLIAGASLGPEASLMMMSAGIGSWLASKAGLGKATELLILASIGALLVVFCGSILPVLMPLLMLWQKKLLSFASAIPILIAGFTAFGTLWLIDHDIVGYGSIPAKPHFSITDLLLAIVVGIGAAVLGWALKQLILWLAAVNRRIDESLPWVVSGGIFGLVIGILYWLGGQQIQFSGSHGSALLLEHTPAYGLWALVGILLTKLLATAWSLAAGYQGGLIFPSIFMGVAIALIAQNIFGSDSPGILVGGVAGVFGAMTGPAIALIFICSVLPIKLAGVAIAGIFGATIGNRIIASFQTRGTPKD